jgi:tetratricopeptide (TPR) repeat protein
MPAEMTAPLLERYEQLKRQAELARERGDLEAALAFSSEAWSVASAAGDSGRTDRALCDRAIPAIELGDWETPARDLREVLLRSSEAEVRMMASYHLARLHELRKETRKALFHARAARQYSQEFNQERWSAATLNQLGNLLLAESQTASAFEAYTAALLTMPPDNQVWYARVLDNLGYCCVLQGSLREGFSLLLKSLRTLRRLGARRYEISTRLDLCFTYLEAGRYNHAYRHGAVALQLADELADGDAVKNALYLLGEAANLSGQEDRARELFARLQHDFYPGRGFVTDFLLAVDVRQMVNLRA